MRYNHSVMSASPHLFKTLADPDLVRLLQQGAVGILPTDTVYGIVAPIAHADAVARLYQTKHREGKPGTVIAADTAQLESLGIDPAYLERVAHLWPDAVSVVLPVPATLSYAHQGKGSLAVRIPRNTQLQALLEATGPLVTSSANQPGEPVSNTVQEAQACFGDTVDFYVDAGDMSNRPASTVVQLTDDGELVVLRQGTSNVRSR